MRQHSSVNIRNVNRSGKGLELCDDATRNHDALWPFTENPLNISAQLQLGDLRNISHWSKNWKWILHVGNIKVY